MGDKYAEHGVARSHTTPAAPARRATAPLPQLFQMLPPPHQAQRIIAPASAVGLGIALGLDALDYQLDMLFFGSL
jgi:hypothetical protein